MKFLCITISVGFIWFCIKKEIFNLIEEKNYINHVVGTAVDTFGI